MMDLPDHPDIRRALETGYPWWDDAWGDEYGEGMRDPDAMFDALREERSEREYE